MNALRGMRYPDALLPCIDHFERQFNKLAEQSGSRAGPNLDSGAEAKAGFSDTAAIDPAAIEECNRLTLGLQVGLALLACATNDERLDG